MPYSASKRLLLLFCNILVMFDIVQWAVQWRLAMYIVLPLMHCKVMYMHCNIIQCSASFGVLIRLHMGGSRYRPGLKLDTAPTLLPAYYKKNSSCDHRLLIFQFAPLNVFANKTESLFYHYPSVRSPRNMNKNDSKKTTSWTNQYLISDCPTTS